MNCPFCKNSLTNQIDKIDKNCPFCRQYIYDEIHANFKKLIDFKGKFIRVHHAQKSFPFIKAYFPGKQNDFVCEQDTDISVGDTVEVNNVHCKVKAILPFFNANFYFAELIKVDPMNADK